jgi:uncharacterized OsmC-like protein
VTTPIPVIAAPEGATVWVERLGPRTYRGRTSRGSSVLIGPGPDDGFWPGELLKLALAGCSGMSADAALTRRLGDDAPVTIVVDGVKHPSEDRFTDLGEHLLVDLSGLSEEERSRLVQVVDRAIAAACTIGNTVAQGAAVHLAVESAEPA